MPLARRPYAALLAAVLAWPAQRPTVRDNEPFRSEIELTSITATVRDADGRLVTGLSRDAFEVYEDGDRQEVAQFTNERVPLALGVLLDISDSMFGRRIEDARTAVYRFLFDLLDASDEFFILAFNHRPHVLTRWTHTPAVVDEALASLRPAGGTAVYDAVAEAMPLIAARNRERAALLIVSDGADTASSRTLRDIRSALQRSDAFVYAIAIDSPEQHAINTRVNPTALRELTDQSGGRTEVVQTSAELVSATDRIAEELNHQYVLGYTPPHAADGRFHTIRVRIRGGEYRVRARNGYVADARQSKS
jgi:Ca-activated chloride channel family protein